MMPAVVEENAGNVWLAHSSKQPESDRLPTALLPRKLISTCTDDSWAWSRGCSGDVGNYLGLTVKYWQPVRLLGAIRKAVCWQSRFYGKYIIRNI